LIGEAPTPALPRSAGEGAKGDGAILAPSPAHGWEGYGGSKAGKHADDPPT
jgi:hypothetical protein